MSNPLQTAYAPQGGAEQRIYTPSCIRELIHRVWPEGLGCDPFPGDLAPISALAAVRLRDGFSEPWLDRSYANPPFNRLKEAMAIAANELGETMLLGPAQTHRQWFWDYRGQQVAWLKPLKFEGFPGMYPKPLCLHYWGDRAEAFASHARALGLARHIGREA